MTSTPHLLRLIDPPPAGAGRLDRPAAPGHPSWPRRWTPRWPQCPARAGEQPLADNRWRNNGCAGCAAPSPTQPLADAGRAAALRLFGDAPGAYGAGVNRLTERSAAWRERDELARAYRLRMGHGYGLDADGDAATPPWTPRWTALPAPTTPRQPSVRLIGQ